MNNFNPTNQYYQPYFLQSQGNVYMIDNPQDVANVPIGAGVSVAVNLKDGLIYLKAIQNGVPMLLGYRLTPLDASRQTTQEAPAAQTEPTMEQRIVGLLESLESRISTLEGAKKQKGGTEKWQI